MLYTIDIQIMTSVAPEAVDQGGGKREKKKYTRRGNEGGKMVHNSTENKGYVHLFSVCLISYANAPIT